MLLDIAITNTALDYHHRPAKTVVFTDTMKFDGREQRRIRTSEYIQMSGRAGRRNCDKFGLSILMIDPKEDPDELEQMLQGMYRVLSRATWPSPSLSSCIIPNPNSHPCRFATNPLFPQASHSLWCLVSAFATRWS